MTIKMRALGYQNYEGKWYKNGDMIAVKNETDAADMVALRLAERAPEAAVPAYETRDSVADVTVGTSPDSSHAAPEASVAKPVKKGGRYGHREMRVR